MPEASGAGQEAGLQLLPWGGQLLRADLPDGPLLYASPWPAAPGAAVRGGIPVIFPQFAAQGPLAKHGFARNLPWRVTASSPAQVVAELGVMAGSRDDWPHAADLRLVTSLRREAGRDCFEQVIEVHNAGGETWAFTGGLHPYWAVSDLSRVVVEGLPLSGIGSSVIDAWYPGGEPLCLRDGHRRVHLSQQGFEGWQAWTPGPAHALTDLPMDDWRRFLCLEPMLMTPRALRPGERWQGVLRAEVSHD